MYQETECGCEHHGYGGGPGIGHGVRWGHHGYGGWDRMHHGGGCCCSYYYGGGMHHGPHFGLFRHRHFINKEEIITRLEEYLKQLQAETKGVEERIDELKKES